MLALYVVGAILTLIATALAVARYDADGWEYIEFEGIGMGCLAGVMTGLLWPLTITLTALAGLLYIIVKKLVPYFIGLFAKEATNGKA